MASVCGNIFLAQGSQWKLFINIDVFFILERLNNDWKLAHRSDKVFQKKLVFPRITQTLCSTPLNAERFQRKKLLYLKKKKKEIVIGN
jgi:hypothetical protein